MYPKRFMNVFSVFLCAVIWSVVSVAFADTDVTTTVTPDISKVTVKDMQGRQHVLGHYQGKWLIVNYWATWCPPCLEEMPDLVNLYDARKSKDVMVIGIAWDYKTTEEVARFADDMLVSYPIVLGSEKIAKQLGGAEVMPTTFIYNPEGKLIKSRRGLISRAYIEQLISTNEPKIK